MKLKQRFIYLLTLVMLSVTQVSWAGIILQGTRIVFPSNQRDASLKITNENDKPVLVHTWADDGNSKSTPKDAKSPFIIPAPVFRLDPKKQHVIRMVYSGEALAKDRESLYWLNVLEIPSTTAADAEQNLLLMAFRNRIKIFYRPVELTQKIEDAPYALRASIQASGNSSVIRIKNPTPFHLSFSNIEVSADGVTYTHPGGGMVEPFAEKNFDLPQLKKPLVSSGAKINLSLINDYGGDHKLSMSHEAVPVDAEQ